MELTKFPLEIINNILMFRPSHPPLAKLFSDAWKYYLRYCYWFNFLKRSITLDFDYSGVKEITTDYCFIYKQYRPCEYYYSTSDEEDSITES